MLTALAATLLSNAGTNLSRRLQKIMVYFQNARLQKGTRQIQSKTTLEDKILRSSPASSPMSICSTKSLSESGCFSQLRPVLWVVGCFRKGCVYIPWPFAHRSNKYFSRQVSRLQKSTVHNLSFSLARDTPKKNTEESVCSHLSSILEETQSPSESYPNSKSPFDLTDTKIDLRNVALPWQFRRFQKGTCVDPKFLLNLKHWWETGAMDPKTNHSKISQEKLLPRSGRPFLLTEKPRLLNTLQSCYWRKKMLKALKLEEP